MRLETLRYKRSPCDLSISVSRRCGPKVLLCWRYHRQTIAWICLRHSLAVCLPHFDFFLVLAGAQKTAEKFKKTENPWLTEMFRNNKGLKTVLRVQLSSLAYFPAPVQPVPLIPTLIFQHSFTSQVLWFTRLFFPAELFFFFFKTHHEMIPVQSRILIFKSSPRNH